MSDIAEPEIEIKRSEKILKYRQVNKLNNTEIAKLVGCSRENVRQVLELRGLYSPRAPFNVRDCEEGMDEIL